MNSEMSSDEDIEQKLEKAVNGEYHLRDLTGCIYSVDSFDTEGVYITADESDTFHISRSQLTTFRFVTRTITPQQATNN